MKPTKSRRDDNDDQDQREGRWGVLEPQRDARGAQRCEGWGDWLQPQRVVPPLITAALQGLGAGHPHGVSGFCFRALPWGLLRRPQEPMYRIRGVFPWLVRGAMKPNPKKPSQSSQAKERLQ